MTTVTPSLDPERLALAIHAAGAVRFGAFRLKLHEQQPDAPLSPVYLDLRVLRSFPASMDVAVAAYRALLQNVRCDLLADVPMAGTPFVAILSHLTRIPQITPREPKTHGSGATIDGTFAPGQTAAVLDDVVTTAGSKLEAIRRLEDGGLRVRDVLVLVDREQGGAEQVATAGYTLHAAIRFSELLAIYRRTGVVAEPMYQRITAYVRATA